MSILSNGKFIILLEPIFYKGTDLVLSMKYDKFAQLSCKKGDEKFKFVEKTQFLWIV